MFVNLQYNQLTILNWPLVRYRFHCQYPRTPLAPHSCPSSTVRLASTKTCLRPHRADATRRIPTWAPHRLPARASTFRRVERVALVVIIISRLPFLRPTCHPFPGVGHTSQLKKFNLFQFLAYFKSWLVDWLIWDILQKDFEDYHENTFLCRVPVHELLQKILTLYRYKFAWLIDGQR